MSEIQTPLHRQKTTYMTNIYRAFRDEYILTAVMAVFMVRASYFSETMKNNSCVRNVYPYSGTPFRNRTGNRFQKYPKVRAISRRSLR